MTKKTIYTITLAAMMALSSMISAFASEEKDYSIESASWNQNETAAVAEWEKPESSTSYTVTLYKQKGSETFKKIKSVSATGTSYDFTQDIISGGSGDYYYFVKPKKGKKEDGANSDILEADSGFIKKAKKEIENAKKAADPYYSKAYNADGTLKTVTVKCNEGSVPDGQIRELNIVSANNCDIISCSIDAPREQWAMGYQRTVTVVLKAKEGYKFTSATEYKSSLMTYQSNTGDEQNRTVVFTFMPRIKLPGITGLTIDSDGIMKWDKVDKASYYYLTLKDGQGESLFRDKVKKNSFDLNDYIEDTGSLQLYSANKASGYVRSDTLKIDDFQAFRGDNQLSGHFEKSGSALRYLDENEEYVTGWNQIGGSWYYFNENGKSVGPGWWQDKDNPNDPNAASGGSWYYFDNDHRMLTDTVTPDGCRVDADGRWIK